MPVRPKDDRPHESGSLPDPVSLAQEQQSGWLGVFFICFLTVLFGVPVLWIVFQALFP